MAPTAARCLRFNQSEVRAVIRREGSSRDPAELTARTHGWAVAVVLLLRTAAPNAPLDDREAVFQFIASELIEQLDSASRELLTQVALLPTFTLAMARALTGEERTEEIVDALLSDHLLIERHGEGAFRLHDLLRAFLLDHGERAYGPERWIALVRRAARILADGDQIAAALDLIATAKDFALLAELIEGAAPALASQARFQTLQSAIALVPPDVRAERPWLLFWQAAAGLGRPGNAPLPLAQAAFERFRSNGDIIGALLSWALVIPAVLYAGDDFRGLEPWLALRDELPRDIPVPQIAARVALSELIALGFLPPGHPRASLEAVHAAFEVVLAAGSAEDKVHACAGALFDYCIAGHFERAREVTKLAERELAHCAHNPLSRVVWLETEAFLLMASSRYRGASDAVDQGLELARESGIDVWRVGMHYIGAMGALARRDFVTVERLLSEASTISGSRLARSHYECGRAWLAFERRDLDSARLWIHRAVEHSELIMRADARRVLIVAPGSLVEQWRDELREKFGLDFRVFSRELEGVTPSGNPFEDVDQLIVRLDQIPPMTATKRACCSSSPMT